MATCSRLAAAALVVVAAAVSARPAALDVAAAAQARLLGVVTASRLASPARRLVSAAFVCMVTVGRERFGVIDLREVILKAGSPGGLNRVLLLDADDHLSSSFEYGLARPIACRGASLLLFGEVDPRHDGREGNVVVYGPKGQIADVRSVDAAALWPAR